MDSKAAEERISLFIYFTKFVLYENCVSIMKANLALRYTNYGPMDTILLFRYFSYTFRK